MKKPVRKPLSEMNPNEIVGLTARELKELLREHAPAQLKGQLSLEQLTNLLTGKQNEELGGRLVCLTWALVALTVVVLAAAVGPLVITCLRR